MGYKLKKCRNIYQIFQSDEVKNTVDYYKSTI